MELAPGREEEIVNRVKGKWGGRTIILPNQQVVGIPIVRDGGATDQLIRVAVRTALEAVDED